MPANEVMKPLHERMPAIIVPAHYDLWLDSRVTDKDEIMTYLNSAPSSQLMTYPISPWVNSPKHDNERCLEPAATSPQEGSLCDTDQVMNRNDIEFTYVRMLLNLTYIYVFNCVSVSVFCERHDRAVKSRLGYLQYISTNTTCLEQVSMSLVDPFSVLKDYSAIEHTRRSA
jgi:hypothetical protein